MTVYRPPRQQTAVRMSRSVRNAGGRGVAIVAVLGAALLTSALLACRADRAQPAVPDSTDAAPPAPPPVALSRFDVPLQYDFTPVLGVIERVVPTTFGSIGSMRALGGDERKRYAYEARRGPFTAFADGAQVHLRATLSYAARGSYTPPIGPTVSTGCGLDGDRPRITVELATPITLTSNWRLASRAALARIAPASSADRDRCTVSILRYDVTEQVVDAARKALTAKLPTVDRKIADVDLKDRFTEWWRLLNRPIRLTDGVWLLLEPEQLRLGRVTGEGRTLTIQAGLDARPRIVTGASEPVATVPPLPPLARDTVGGGFRIVLDGIVDYATATRAVNGALRGKTVGEAGRSVTISSATLTPAGAGRLALAVAFGGDASGTLRFVGVPRYDTAQGRITVPSLDYDLQTNNQLINAYAWLRSDALRQLFREKATVPVAPVLDSARSLLALGLNRDIGGKIRLSATVDTVAVKGLYVTRAGLVVRGEAAGAAGVAVLPRSAPR